MPAVDLLARAHGLHPGAKRILLIDRGNWTGPHPAIEAMAVGKIDYYLYVPWFPLERNLHPPVSEFLAAWDKSRTFPRRFPHRRADPLPPRPPAPRGPDPRQRAEHD